MKRKLEKQQLEYIKNFLLVNRYGRLTNTLKVFIVLLIGVLTIIFIYFSKTGKDKVLKRDKGYIKKDERIGQNFNTGLTISAEDSTDGKVYLLKENRVEVQEKKTGIWKTYPISIEGKYITATTNNVAILTKNDELYMYDKDFKSYKILYNNKKSNSFKSIEEIEKIYPFAEKVIAQGDKKIELYNLKEHGWEESPFKYSKEIKKHIKVMEYDVYVTDYGIAYYDGKSLIEKKIDGVKDIGGISLKSGYVITEKNELYKISFENGITKELILKDTSYKGNSIDSVDLVQNNILIKDLNGDIYKYDIEKREWSEVEKNIKKLLSSTTDLLMIRENEIVLYNLTKKYKQKKKIKVIEAYTEGNKFYVIAEENKKNVFLELDFDTTNYIIGRGSYEGNLSDVDDFYYYNDKIFVLKPNNKLQYYSLKLKEWKNLELVIDSKVKRVRSNTERVLFLTKDGTLIKYGNDTITIEKDIASFELVDDNLYTLNKLGVLSINGEAKKFKNKSPYKFENILGVVELEGVYVIFKNGIVKYNIEDGNWERKKEFNSEISDYYVNENKIYAYGKNNLQSIDLKEFKLEVIDFKKDIIAAKKNWILTKENESFYIHLEKDKYENEKILSKGIGIKNLADITSVENYNEKLYVTYQNNIYSYDKGIWKFIEKFQEPVKIVCSNKNGLFLEGKEKLYILKNEKIELLEENYKKTAILLEGVVFYFQDKLVYLDLNDMKKIEFFKGKLDLNEKFEDVYLSNEFLYVIGTEQFYRYNLNTYSWESLRIGEKINGVFSKEKYYYLKKNNIFYIELASNKEFKEIKYGAEADKIWCLDNGALLYKYKDSIYKDKNQIFKGSKIPFDYLEVKEFLSNENDIYVILERGFGKYNLITRVWEFQNIDGIKKTRILDKSIYNLAKSGIYKDDKKVIEDFNISDFGIFNNKLIYLKNNRVIGIKEFSGQEPKEISELLDYKVLEDKYIFSLGSDIYIYDKKIYSWEKIENYKKIINFEVDGNKLYVFSNNELKVYSFQGDILLNKSFDGIIIDKKVENSEVAVLLEKIGKKELYIYSNNSWINKEMEAAPFKYEDIIDFYGIGESVYFLTKNGVFKKENLWKNILLEKFTDGKLEKYNGELAVIEANRVIFLNENKRQNISNYSYLKNNVKTYYLLDGVLYSDDEKNSLDEDILQNVKTSFINQEKYYYISEYGIGKYNYKTHTWSQTKEKIGVINTYLVSEDMLILNTKLGLFKVNLNTLKLTKYLENKDVLNSNLRYAVVESNGKKELYEFNGNIYNKVDNTSDEIEFYAIKGVDLIQDKLFLYSENGSVYSYNEEKNTLEKEQKTIKGSIITTGNYKNKPYIFTDEKIYIDSREYKGKSYSTYGDQFYLIDENGVYNLNNEEYIFEELKGVYGNDKDIYFTNHGSYEYNRDFGIYYKIDDENRDRIKEKEVFVIKANDSIEIYLKNVLQDKVKILGGTLGFNINGDLKTYFQNKELRQFNIDEKIESLTKIEGSIIYFRSTLGRIYAYDYLKKRIKLFKENELKKETKRVAFKYNNVLKGIFIDKNELIFLNNKGKTLSLSIQDYKFLRKNSNLDYISSIKYSFQENRYIYIRDSKGVLKGETVDKLSYINSFDGIKNRVTLKLNSLNNLEYKIEREYIGKDYLITDEGNNKDAFISGRLKIKTPKDIILDKNTGFKYVYQKLNDKKEIEQNYFYLFNGKMEKTISKDIFNQKIMGDKFQEDYIISISNNPEDKLYLATPNIIYDENFDILYKGSGIKRVNGKNGKILIEKSDGIYQILDGKLVKVKDVLDSKKALNFNGENWINEYNQDYKIKVLDNFINEKIFDEGYLVHENLKRISSVEKLEVSNGKNIFSMKSLKGIKYVKKDDFIEQSLNLKKGKDILLEILKNTKNKVNGIETYDKNIYLLTENHIMKLNDSGLSEIDFKGKKMDVLGDKLVVFNSEKGYVLDELGKLNEGVSRTSKNKVVIFQNILKNTISESGEQIQFDNLKNSEIFKNKYFIFDDMVALDFKDNRFYREYEKIAHETSVENLLSLGKIINPIKKENILKKIVYDYYGNLKVEVEKLDSKAEKRVQFMFEDKRRDTLTYNLFKNIETNYDDLYLFGDVDNYKIEVKNKKIKFIGEGLEKEILDFKKERVGKRVEFQGEKINVENTESSGIKWNYYNLTSEDLWREVSSNNYNFIFNKYTDYTEGLEYYASEKFIFKDTKDLYLNFKKNIDKVEVLDNKLYFLNNGKVYNEKMIEVSLRESPFIKMSLDLKDGTLKNFENNKNLINFQGENIYGDNGKLIVDENQDLKLDTDKSLMYSSNYGVLKRRDKNLDMIEKTKNKNLENYNNQVIIEDTKVLNKEFLSEGNKIFIKNYSKSIIENNDFIWSNPQMAVIGDVKKISNVKGEIWDIDNLPKYIDKKSILNAQEVMYKNKLYLFDKNELKLNNNLSELEKLNDADYYISKHLNPQKLGLIFENNQWEIKLNNEKIQLVGVDLKDTIISGKFNFDFIKALDSKNGMYSNKYIWNIENKKLILKMQDEISDVWKVNKEIYFKIENKWKNLNGEIIDDVIIVNEDKWKWTLNLEKKKIKFENVLDKSLKREFYNRQFKDDVLLNIKGDKEKLYISTFDAVILYDKNYSKILKYLDTYKKQEQFYFDKIKKEVYFEPVSIPKELFNQNYLDYYLQWEIYHIIKSNKIELINKS